MAYGAGTPTAAPAQDAQAMNDPKAAARAKLFRPQFEGETLGKALSSMLWDGRKVIDQERPRQQANRKMYRGEQYLHVSKTGVRTLAPTDKLPNGIRRVTINRMRPLIDARIAMFTYKRPDFEVQTSSKSLQDLEARRIATSLVDSEWGQHAWDIDEYNRTALLYAEQDGVCAGFCLYDKTDGKKIPVMVDAATGQPIQDPEVMAAYKETDPTGMVLWQTRELYEGNVKPRIVRIGSLSVDPFARTDPNKAHWVIESEIMPRWKVEQMAGMKIEELCHRSKVVTGTTPGAGDKAEAPSAAQFDDPGGPGEQVSSAEGLTVRHAFMKPTGAYGRWPMGAHIVWIDIAPDYPIVMEPWDRDLPYKFFVPRHDGGNFLQARGMADDLGPVQVAFNRVVSMLHEWLDLVGRPPLIVQNGVLRTKNIFNESRIVNVNGGQPPFFMPVPSEPTAVFTHHLLFLLEQMKEIAAQHDAARGQAPGKGIEAGVSLDMLIQQNEQTVSPYAEAFRAFLEWTLSTCLSEVADNYSLPRLIQGAVGDDPSAFRDFIGARIKGATAVRVVGPLTPRARATQVQMLLELAQYTGGRFDPSRWITQLLEGNIDEIIEGERAQLQAQKREIDDILALGARPDTNQLWMAFQEAEQAYIGVIQRLRDVPEQGGEDPVTTLRTMRKPTRPPTLANVGIMLPEPTDADNDPLHIMVLDEFVISPAYKHQHPLVKRALKEHRLVHQQRLAQRMMALADQGGGPSGPPTDDQGQDGPPSDQEGPPQ